MAIEAIIGLETGDLSEFDGGSGVIVSAQKRTGSYAAYNSAGGGARLYKAGSSADVYVLRFGFYLSLTPALTTSVAQIEDSGGTAVASLSILTDRRLRLQASGGSAQDSSTAISVGSWYVLEIGYVKGTGTDAVAQLRIEETIEATSSDGTSTSQAGRIAFNSGSDVQIFDDIRFDSMSGAITWIGNGRINAMRPNAAGDETGFSGTWADIDDDPINDSTSRQSNGAVTCLDNLTNSSAFDETPSTVNYLIVYGRLVRTSGPGRTHHLRSKKSGGSGQNSADLGLTTSPAFYSFAPSDQPTSASDLDSWQAGGAKGGGSGGREIVMIEIWVMVDYVPDTGGGGAVVKDVIGLGVVPFAR